MGRVMDLDLAQDNCAHLERCIAKRQRDILMYQKLLADAEAEVRHQAQRQLNSCCLTCGFTPYQTMEEYIDLHGEDVKCFICKQPLVGQTEGSAAEWHKREQQGQSHEPHH